MINKPERQQEEHLAKIASELRLIRMLLMAMVGGLAVIFGVLINAQITVVMVITGLGLWLFTIIVHTLLQRAQRRRLESERLRDLSGRQGVSQ